MGTDRVPKVLSKSSIGKTLFYLTAHIRPLPGYTLDGRYHINNNLVGNSVRPAAIGRKGYLFCGNPDAAENAAVYYTTPLCTGLLQTGGY
jgi:hypothetical protein